ncbi:N-acetylmuramoyl-L-alanine amidase [Shewanella sp. NIFS-20-20]|uniref:N-acetylmuramoyl-L-alanine amidase n=1 Tax=Shewanella sp. NIFS-20-20 TaxID=2853806 RepID=UPI001C492895|nr:N-acetylmuramoyl-L-alanine amidase [Shewanella sp. NIFS-20-20]MBV7316746.1 N-acetylmuramoyl-L-alanine amidase [Shewanella sp. NIFS-20-20]
MHRLLLRISPYFTLLALLSLSSSALANQLQGVRIWAAPESTRVVYDLSESPDYSFFTLSNPERLVIDLKQTKTKLKLDKIDNKSQLVKRVRLSKPPQKGTLRLVIDLNRAVKTNIYALAPTAPYGNRLVLDLSDTQSDKKPVVIKKPQDKRDIIVAIDAGHGGEDPGSIGPSGVYEKKVVLEIAKRVAKHVNSTPGMEAVMTRTGDYFVNLNRRSDLARDRKADILISIHADAFTSPQPKGASVWVLSRRRANSEIGRWLEQKEKHSELLGGAGEIIQSTDSEQYLTMTLLDMSMDKSMAVSHSIADDLLRDLGKVTHLHKSKPEAASFAVLKSPDIPSILVETGFISNPGEERNLVNHKHQERLAKAIHSGLVRYFEANPPEGSLFAANISRKHKVARGESLSVIAQRYQVSVSNLKKANNLKSDVVRVGQQLTIPKA